MSYDVLTPDAAQLLPYLPNWDDGFDVTRSFETDIFTSRDNTEQRRALRFNPRFEVKYRTTAFTEAERREVQAWLRTWQNKPAIVPDFARWARLTGASAGGATVLTIDPMPPWVSAGQRLVLCGATMEDIQVDSVAGTTINLTDTLDTGWSIGSVLRPTFHGLLDGKLSSRRYNKAAAELSINLAVYPGGEPLRAAGTAWASVGTREVFTLEPDFRGSPSLDYLWPVEDVDFNRGRTAQFRPVADPQRALVGDFNGLGITTAAEVEQFFDRMKGRRTAFYLPTGENDGVFVASGAATITLSGSSLVSQFTGFDFASYEFGIAICLADGTDLYRRISAIALTGSDSLVTVTSPWGVALTDITRISLMPLVRLASDEMTMSWRSPLSANARLAFQSVRR